MAKAKRNVGIATYAGLIVIIIFIALFIYNAISFVRNYDAVKLTAALNSNAIEVVQSQEMQDVLHEISEKYFPVLKTALVKKMKQDAPQFRQSSQEVAANLKSYLKNQVKPKLSEALAKELFSSESVMLSTYSKSKPSLEKINQIIENSHQYLLENITKSLDYKLDQALNTLAGLNGSFQTMYSSMEDTPVLKGLTPEMTGEVENRLIENLLELIIYQLNPQKGNMPAFANGGAE